jgi:hypothetical protein
MGSGSCIEAGAADDDSALVEEGTSVVVACWTPTSVGSAEGEANVDKGFCDEIGKGAGSGTTDEVCGGSIVRIVEVVVE